MPDDKGNWTGIDVDYCRAVAAAVFGDAKKVKFVPLTAKERFTALQSGEVDVLSRNTTWTMSRDSSLGLTFIGVMYYDGQGFMVPKTLGVKSAKELNGATCASQTGTTTELNLADYFRTNNMTYRPVVFEKARRGQCRPTTPAAATSTPPTSRASIAQRLRLPNPDDHVVLPEIISKEPLGPSVRQGDYQWFTLVQVGALRAAQRRGARRHAGERRRDAQARPIPRSSACSAPRASSARARPRQRLGRADRQGASATTARSSSATSARTTPLKIARGLNKLWNKGGLQYAPPIR